MKRFKSFLVIFSVLVSSLLCSLVTPSAAADTKKVPLKVREINQIIKSIEQEYICGRRGMSEGQWNEKVKYVRDKIYGTQTYDEYINSLRYVGTLLDDAHFAFPDDGVYNRQLWFSKTDTIFPLRVKTWRDGSVYCVKDYTGVIPKNAQIVTVNSASARDLSLTNMSMFPGEERNAREFINKNRENDVRSWNNLTNHLYMEGYKAPFTVVYIPKGDTLTKTALVQGMTRGDIIKAYKKSGDKKEDDGVGTEPLEYKNLGDGIAVLTINTFSLRQILGPFLSESDGSYSRYLSKTMKQLQNDSDVEDLIIDCRDNGGGDGNNVCRILDYFIDDPDAEMDMASIVKVTDENRPYVRKFISDRYKFLGFGKDKIGPLLALIDSVPSGTAVPTDTLFEIVWKPDMDKYKFKGNLYLLTNELSYSATLIFYERFRQFGLGQTAGVAPGGYKSTTNSLRAPKELPGNNWLSFTMPFIVEKFNAYIYEYPEPVDIPLEVHFEEWITDSDSSLDRLVEIIKKRN